MFDRVGSIGIMPDRDNDDHGIKRGTYTMNDLVTRASISELVANRDRALKLFVDGYAMIEEASRAARLAAPHAHTINPVGHSTPRADAWRKSVDKAAWLSLLRATSLDMLFDATAKRAFYDQLEKDPPIFDAETAEADMLQRYRDRNETWKRGIATAFARLDKRFKTHDGFKIGSKIIMNNAVGEWGSLHTHEEDVLIDIERIFFILDEKQPIDTPRSRPDTSDPRPYWGVVGIAAKIAGAGLKRCAGEGENEYFRIKCFLNGNIHLHFKRDDLVAKVNEALAAYYGATLGDSHTKTHRNSTHVAKNHGAFMTPAPVVEKLFDRLYRIKEGARALEPSCGTGNLAVHAANVGMSVDCIEIDRERCLQARARGLTVTHADFLEVLPTPVYDYVIMNPPFDRGLDCDHVRHALKFLKPGGELLAIMSAGAAYNEGRAADFRALLESYKGSSYERLFLDLPERSFAPETNVNAVTLHVKRSA